MSSAAEQLQPLRCARCGAFVPLADSPHQKCAYCQAPVEVPQRYRALFREHALETHLRREVEQRFQALSRPPPRAAGRLAYALVLLLPVVAGYGYCSWTLPMGPVVVFSLVVVPAALPGTALWVWNTVVNATIVRFHFALASAPPEREGGPQRCRNCGAPLSVEPGAFSVRCGYCGTDSLLLDVANLARALHTRLRGELRTLAQAVEALRLRRRMLVAGIALGTAALLCLAAAAVVIASVL